MVQFFSEAVKDGYAKGHAAVPQGREYYVGSRETKEKHSVCGIPN
jgi:hypothetical protein